MYLLLLLFNDKLEADASEQKRGSSLNLETKLDSPHGGYYAVSGFRIRDLGVSGGN